MSFHGQSFANRFAAMGDEAEQTFEQVHPHKWVRHGLNRPPLHMASLPTRVRYSPDYLTTAGFYECKGAGRDQTLKLKVENLNALHFWNQIFDTHLWVWDSHKRRYGSLTIKQVQKFIDDPEGGVTLDHFHDGKAFFALPLSSIPIEWTGHDAT